MNFRTALLRSIRRILPVLGMCLASAGCLKDAYMVDSLTTESKGGLADNAYLPVGPLKAGSSDQRVVPPPFNLDIDALPDSLDYCSIVRNDPASHCSGNISPKSETANSNQLPPSSGSLANPTNSSSSTVSTSKASILDLQAINRNRLAYYLIYRSNLICEAHEAAIMTTSSELDFALAQISSTLSGLGTIVTGAYSIRILSGLATMADATQGNINSKFYEGKLTSAIVQTIEENRQNALAGIQTQR